ncbi:anhydro-N-acetylmuramic acid kinase [Algivirga pacifica]|uniref:Anhydro-N-acetylmuramic acid kinase n=1 Tax=Algivirga pacifica TaxID=1162670 RepID=A0ABP9DLM6_9BACT
MSKTYRVIGLMSGTSLDGVDLAYCEFTYKNEKWSYEMPITETIAYSKEWITRLSEVENASALEYALTDKDLGDLLGSYVKEFIQKHQIQPDFIGSHGHTIFHQPEKGLTTQIGSGANLSVQSGLPVVCDFRTVDLALGGQGAPLVPIGDQLLFSTYDYCINLGGIANISYQSQGEMQAFDISPANMPLNHYMRLHKELEYDKDGALAATGTVQQSILDALNALPYYQEPAPKSLGKEWVLEFIYPLLEQINATEDLLATAIEHTAMQIGQVLQAHAPKGKVLLTGGGAFNKHLVERIKHYSPSHSIIVPDAATVSFKEALIFGFLAVLRVEQQANCLQSVTGAKYNNCGGAIYHPQVDSSASKNKLEENTLEEDDYSPLSNQGFNRLIGCGG